VALTALPAIRQNSPGIEWVMRGVFIYQKFPSYSQFTTPFLAFSSSHTTSPYWNHMNSVHTFPIYFFKIHFNFIHPSMSGFSKWPVSFRFSNQFLYTPICATCFIQLILLTRVIWTLKWLPPCMFLPNLVCDCVTNWQV